VRRRDLLRGATISAAASPSVASLLDALVSPRHSNATLLPALEPARTGAQGAQRRQVAYTQWGRYDHGLTALRTAYEVAPEEIRCRPAVQRIAADLALLAKGSARTAVVDFARRAGIRL
jgi:hypothetical protein